MRNRKPNNRRPIRKWVRFHRCEFGGGYTLSYVVVIPFLMLLVCTVVETSMLMLAKLGTIQAAHAAGRVISVQQTNVGWPVAQSRMRDAAARAMLPFASFAGGLSASRGTPGPEIEDAAAAYGRWADEAVAKHYRDRKAADVLANLTVRIDGPASRHDAMHQIAIQYDFAFRVPGIGRIFGQPRGDQFFVPLRTQLSFVHDGPQNDSQTTGIGYASP